MITQFDKYGYEFVKDAISNDACKILENEMKLVLRCNQTLNPHINFYGDEDVANCYRHYSLYGFESLLMLMKDKVEKVVNKELYPTYSFARIYYRDAILTRHKDREACQYSVTMTISADKDKIWDIYLKDYQGNEKSLNIPVGSMVVYKGDELEHWREPYQGEEQIQVFLHYVDKNGKYKDDKYDRRLHLGLPK